MNIYPIQRGELFGSEVLKKKELIHRSAIELDQLFETLAQSNESEKTFDLLAEWIPLEQVEKAANLRSAQAMDTLQKAQNLYREAKYYLQTTECTVPVKLRQRLEGILDTLIHALESILNAFGIAEFFKPAENDIHADFKGQKIMLLLSLFTAMTTAAIPILGSSLASMILGGTMLTVVGLSLLYPLIRPAPIELPQGKNWTREFKQGDFIAPEGRKSTIDEIAHTLAANQNVKMHVMLLGKSGVGKTETVKSLVAAIERGEYPELKGKQMIYFNTANLVNYAEPFSSGNRILEKISGEMGKHRNNYILVFDEIHSACQEKESSAIADQLKTFLDRGKNGFPHVIAITTEKEFFRDIYLRHTAFARRFKRIAIESTSDDETIKILNNAFLKQAPKVILEQGAMQALLQKTKEAFGAETAMPGGALKILSFCIQKTASTQKSPLEKCVEIFREKIQSIDSQRATRSSQAVMSLDPGLLDADFSQLEIALKKEKEQLEHLFSQRDQLAETKRRVFQLAVKISKAKTTQKEKNAFLFLSHYLMPSLEAQIRIQAAQLGVRTVIDENLIDEVIAEEKENLLKADAAVTRGRGQVSDQER